MTQETEAVVMPTGFSRVRLTVTDIQRSKNFYRWLLGREPGNDFSDQIDEPGIRQDPSRTYGGCWFTSGGQTLGLRPVERPATVSIPTGSDWTTSACWSRPSRSSTPRVRVWRRPASPMGVVIELPAFGLAIQSVQDPDDINLELAARIPRS